MDFNKVINNMQEFQSKIEVYEKKNKSIENAINSINKDIIKLEKKISSSKDEIEKHILNIKILLMKDIAKRFDVKEEKKKQD